MDENTVNLLLDLQDKLGFLPKEDMIKLCREKKIPGVYVSGVATFYSQFKFSPPGKYKISVCRGTACHVKNSAGILQLIEEELGIKASGITKDSNISLDCVNCIGACAKAPAIMINGTVYGNLDNNKVKKIIKSLK